MEIYVEKQKTFEQHLLLSSSKYTRFDAYGHFWKWCMQYFMESNLHSQARAFQI